jgi:hypothetical protein
MREFPSILLPWIDALARQVAEDYLRLQAAPQAEHSQSSTYHVPLHQLDKAA